MSRNNSATRRPSDFAPIADSSTGAADPIPIPRIIGQATAKLIAPVMLSAWRIPIAAEAL